MTAATPSPQQVLSEADLSVVMEATNFTYEPTKFARAIESAVLEALAARAEPAPLCVPEGWQLVPKDGPTLGMGWAYLDAARAHMDEETGSHQRFSWPGYRAMLASAPPAAVEARQALSDAEIDAIGYSSEEDDLQSILDLMYAVSNAATNGDAMGAITTFRKEQRMAAARITIDRLAGMARGAGSK